MFGFLLDMDDEVGGMGGDGVLLPGLGGDVILSSDSPGSCRVCLVSFEHGGGCGAGCFDIAGGGGDELLLPVPDCVSSGPQSGGDRGGQLCAALLGSLHVLDGCMSVLGGSVPEPVSFLKNINLVGLIIWVGFSFWVNFGEFLLLFLRRKSFLYFVIGLFFPLDDKLLFVLTPPMLFLGVIPI